MDANEAENAVVSINNGMRPQEHGGALLAKGKGNRGAKWNWTKRVRRSLDLMDGKYTVGQLEQIAQTPLIHRPSRVAAAQQILASVGREQVEVLNDDLAAWLDGDIDKAKDIPSASRRVGCKLRRSQGKYGESRSVEITDRRGRELSRALDISEPKPDSGGGTKVLVVVNPGQQGPPRISEMDVRVSADGT